MIPGSLANLTALLTGIVTLFGPVFGILHRVDDIPPDLSRSVLSFENELDRFAAYHMVDRTRFVLTFEDDFEEESVDRSVWTGHYSPYGGRSVIRKGGYWNSELARTEDGRLIIPLKYEEAGMDGGGPGWYMAGLDSDGEGSSLGFKQTYGYFEIRCILPECKNGRASFWLSNDNVTRIGDRGTDGTEIDVFESLFYGSSNSNTVSSNLHYDGYGRKTRSLGAKRFPVEGDPYAEFNSYALEWNENEYIFYINGEETFRSDFGGVSRNPEYLLLSVELSGKNGKFTGRELDPDREYDFIVDYVRVYQYKERAAGDKNMN